MTIYVNGLPLQTLSSNSPSFELLGNSNERTIVLEVGITLESAATSQFGLGFTTTRGQGPTLLVSSVEDITQPADNEPTMATAWTTPPLIPTTFLRQATISNIGDVIIWTWTKGLVIPVSTSLVLWNLTAIGNANISVLLDD